MAIAHWDEHPQGIIELLPKASPTASRFADTWRMALALANLSETSTQSASPVEKRFQNDVAQYEWEEWHKKIVDMSKLSIGWDSYSAPVPNPVARKNATDFLDKLREFGCFPQRLEPSAVGGIGITFRERQRKAYVEFYNNGRIAVVFSDRESEPTASVVESDDFNSLITRIQNHVNSTAPRNVSRTTVREFQFQPL